MAKEITLPKLSEDVDEGTVAEVIVSEGDSVEEEDPIIAVESDKATVEVPCPEAGTVKEIKVSEGDTIKTGDVILLLEDAEDQKQDEDETDKQEKKSEEEEEKDEEEVKEEKTEEEEPAETEEEEKEEKENAEAEEEKKPAEKKEPAAEEIPAAPGAKRLAREYDVSLEEIEGSGPDGLITEEDVKQAAGVSKGKSVPGTKLPDFGKWGPIERQPLSGIRKATAKQTHTSWQAIPHVTQFDEAAISNIQKYIEENQEEADEKGGKLTITAVLTKLIANALHQFPRFNASIDMENEEVILKKYINIGIAVDTENGLLVPVVRDAEQKTIIELAVEITELAEKTRNNKLSKEEMEGGNFIISNLGGIGGTQFTPVIYHPQVAILGVSEMATKPVYKDGSFEPQLTLPLSLSYDHRLIDGAEGARFLRYVCNALEDPYKALLGE